MEPEKDKPTQLPAPIELPLTVMTIGKHSLTFRIGPENIPKAVGELEFRRGTQHNITPGKYRAILTIIEQEEEW